MAKKVSRVVSIHTMVRSMIERSGMSAAEVSRRIGRSSGYIGVMLHNETMPGADLLADIADACGFNVAIAQNDSGFVLAPGLRLADQDKMLSIVESMGATVETETDLRRPHAVEFESGLQHFLSLNPDGD